MLHLRSKPSEFLYKTLYFSIMMIGKSINLPICVSLQLILSKSSAKINHFSDSVSAASQQTTAACSAHPLRLLCTLTAAHIYILKNLYCASVAFQPNKPIQKKRKTKASLDSGSRFGPFMTNYAQEKTQQSATLSTVQLRMQ